MAVYNYFLGTTTSPKNVEDGFTVEVNPPRSRFVEAAAFVDKLDGSVAGFGSPVAVWTFDILTQAMVDELRTQTGITAGTYSATVYFTARILDGTTALYTGTLIWPQDQMSKRNFNGRYLGLELTFRTLTKIGDALTDSDGATLTDSDGAILYA